MTTTTTTQVGIVNDTDRSMELRRCDRCDHHDQWSLRGEKSYSLSLPIEGERSVEYEIKHGDRRVAKVWINHDGSIEAIKNYRRHYCVMTNNFASGKHHCFDRQWYCGQWVGRPWRDQPHGDLHTDHGYGRWECEGLPTIYIFKNPHKLC